MLGMPVDLSSGARRVLRALVSAGEVSAGAAEELDRSLALADGVVHGVPASDEEARHAVAVGEWALADVERRVWEQALQTAAGSK
jgi:hypothetical protein